jgi:hypothetical protein
MAARADCRRTLARSLATAMLSLSALNWACRYTKPRKRWQRFKIVIRSRARKRVAIGSAFIKNTPMVAMMMIPVVRDLDRQTGLAAPSLFMRLRFASIWAARCRSRGGAVNLILARMVVDAIASGELQGMQPEGMFDLACRECRRPSRGLLYLIFIAPRLLREKKTGDTAGPRPSGSIRANSGCNRNQTSTERHGRK